MNLDTGSAIVLLFIESRSGRLLRSIWRKGQRVGVRELLSSERGVISKKRAACKTALLKTYHGIAPVLAGV